MKRDDGRRKLERWGSTASAVVMDKRASDVEKRSGAKSRCRRLKSAGRLRRISHFERFPLFETCLRAFARARGRRVSTSPLSRVSARPRGSVRSRGHSIRTRETIRSRPQRGPAPNENAPSRDRRRGPTRNCFFPRRPGRGSATRWSETSTPRAVISLPRTPSRLSRRWRRRPWPWRTWCRVPGCGVNGSRIPG